MYLVFYFSTVFYLYGSVCIFLIYLFLAWHNLHRDAYFGSTNSMSVGRGYRFDNYNVLDVQEYAEMF